MSCECDHATRAGGLAASATVSVFQYIVQAIAGDQRLTNAGNATVKNDIVEPQKQAEIDTATNRDLDNSGWLWRYAAIIASTGNKYLP